MTATPDAQDPHEDEYDLEITPRLVLESELNAEGASKPITRHFFGTEFVIVYSRKQLIKY